MSRNVDPAEFLMDLGFGGRSTSVLARMPTRFFTKSHVRLNRDMSGPVIKKYLFVG